MKKLKVLVYALMIVSLAACGGGNSDDSSESSVTVRTTVDLAGTQSTGSFVQSRAAAITVTLTLADGTVYTMSDNGNGEYSCSVANYTDGTAGYIEAHAGDIVLKNFFDDLDDEEGDADIGATDPESTLFVDVLETFAAALINNGNAVTAEELLAGYNSAQLSVDVIDVDALRDEVSDSTTYQELRETYTATLTWENYEAGVDTSSVIAEALESSETVTEIISGGISAPVGLTGKAAVEAVVEEVYTAYMNGDSGTVYAAVDADSFLDNGYGAEEFLEDMAQELGELPDGFTIGVEDVDVSVVETDDENIFGAFVSAHEIIRDANGDIYMENRNDDGEHFVYSQFPFLVEKDGSVYKAIGNQRKSDVWVETTYYRDSEGNYTRGFWAELEATDLYPVTSVTLSSAALADDLTLETSELNDSNEYQVSVNESDDVFYYFGEAGGSVVWTGDLCSDRAVSVSISYEDGSSETSSFTLPDCSDSSELAAMTPSSEVEVSTAGTVDISFELPGSSNEDVGWIYMEIFSTEGYVVYEYEDMPFDTESITVGADVFESGADYRVRTTVGDLEGRTYSTETEFTY